MDNITIVNYQGSKKNLLEFIHSSLTDYVTEDDVILDIFSGTASVAYSYKRTNTVYTNDAEQYATIIAEALLSANFDNSVVQLVENEYKAYQYPTSRYKKWIEEEEKVLQSGNAKKIISFYESIPTIWVDGKKYFKTKNEYSLFVKYYSTSYFGVRQAKDIDAIKRAIDIHGAENKSTLLACLFYAMKECVFSKDGHMAQPLDMEKSLSRLIRLRSKNIFDLFMLKISEFNSDGFVKGKGNNKTFNYNFEELLENEKEISNVSVIYADPPYTDMQYSRYYHLLNTVVQYDYPNTTINNGQATKGLYLENRFQSQLSKKSTCLDSMEILIKYAKDHHITLVISFAYPQDTEKQKTDRYVMDIEDLISKCKEYYPADNVHVLTQNYEHSNNRNSEMKKVLEYLIICERTDN